MRRMSVGEWVRFCFGLSPPARARQCMFRSVFPCNGHCRMYRKCLVAERVRADDGVGIEGPPTTPTTGFYVCYCGDSNRPGVAHGSHECLVIGLQVDDAGQR
jgi:hypothetical protein